MTYNHNVTPTTFQEFKSSLIRGITGSAVKSIAVVWRNFMQRQKVQRLEDLTQRELDDIGITSMDVDYALRNWLRESPADYLSRVRDQRIRRNRELLR